MVRSARTEKAILVPERPSSMGAVNRDPAIRKIVEQVRFLLNGRIGCAPGDKVLAAVSGGLDSMVLLDVLDRLRAGAGIELCVAHLDHRLRRASAGDRRFVEEAARSRGLACRSGRRDVGRYARENGLSIEDAARQVRYRFLEEAAGREGARWIALGHHADDQAETFLLRLLRGSGLTGLGCMSVVRDDRYIRPLLRFRRKDLEAYARAAGLEFREDASNRDPRFARNRIRHELLPLLRKYNPRIVEVLGRTARLLEDEDGFLEEIARKAARGLVEKPAEWGGFSSGKIVLDASRLLDYHIAVQRRVVRALLQGLSEREGPFDFGQVEKVLETVRRADGRLRSIRCGLYAQRVGDRLVLGTFESSAVGREVAVPGEWEIPERGVRLRFRILPAGCFGDLKGHLGGRTAAFDAETFGARLSLRSVRPGDRFQPLGMKGHRKVSDFLIDLKFPRLLRKDLMVLTCGREIVWLVGVRPADPFRVKRDTRRIVLAELTDLWEDS